jgi:hypothetical protein
MKVLTTETEHSLEEHTIIQTKGGSCEGVDVCVELLIRQGVQGEEQRWSNVVSPESSAKLKKLGHHLR